MIENFVWIFHFLLLFSRFYNKFHFFLSKPILRKFVLLVFAMKRLSLLKYPIFFLLGFYSSKFYKAHHLIDSYPEPKSSIKNFLEEKSLIKSDEYDRFTKNMDYFSYFENGLVQKLEGLSIFNVYFQKETAEKINNASKLGNEERSSLGKLYCVFSPNSSVQGHYGIVHGGFAASILDNLLSHLSVLVNDYSPCATANLTINFKKPLFIGDEYLLIAELEKKIDRKIFIKSQILNEKKEVCLEATSLFIAVDWKSAYLKSIIDIVSGKSSQKGKKEDLLHK